LTLDKFISKKVVEGKGVPIAEGYFVSSIEEKEILKKEMDFCKKLYEIIITPDIDVRQLAQLILDNLDNFKKEIPRCDKAFYKIEDALKTLEQNFNNYYKDYVVTNDPTIMIQGFLSDIYQNGKEDPTLVVQLRKIIKYFTDKIKSLRKDLNIVHNPEFLTATNAERDFHMCDRNVIGGNNKDSENLRDFLYSIFGEWKSVPCFLVSPKQSELIKYFSNCFLALKVAYFNNVFESCEKFGVTFDVVKDAISHDPRIGKSHTQVPGPDGHLGFGGYCFPKDINALIKTMNENQIDSGILESAWDYNLKLRGNIQ
jgi:hypothetical protein